MSGKSQSMRKSFVRFVLIKDAIIDIMSMNKITISNVSTLNVNVNNL